MMKISISQLQNYYKIYCAKTPNLKNRFFKTFDEFAYICTRAGAKKILQDFNRKTFNPSKIHSIARDLIMFGNKESFADVDENCIIKPCSTLEATLRLVKNKNIEEILKP